MVARKNLKSNALISVYDKSSLKQLCSALTKFKIGIISTGETAKKIKSLGFKCQDVSRLTGFREILDGRVKTLHPKIHASILFKRNNINHKKTFILRSRQFCASSLLVRSTKHKLSKLRSRIFFCFVTS